MKLLPYKMASESGKLLARELGILRIYPDDRSRFTPKRPITIINWGCSFTPDRLQSRYVRWINNPESVSLASNKLRAFGHLSQDQQINIPDWTTDKTVVESWLRDGDTVFARKYLASHSGRGIIELDGDSNIPDAPLYTKYIKKKYEYRAHVLPSGRFHLVQKRRSNSIPDDQINWRIRNHSNGFIFAEELAFRPPDIEDQCFRARNLLGLDFCAFDVVFSTKDEKSVILEANTAPGLTGRTLSLYKEELKCLSI